MAQIISQPRTPADFANNVRAARMQGSQSVGLRLATGSAGEIRALSQADQIRVTDATAQFITQNPSFFNGDQLRIARSRVASPNFGKALADTSLFAAAKEFGTDFAGRVETRFFFLLAVGITVAIASNVIIARMGKR